MRLISRARLPRALAVVGRTGLDATFLFFLFRYKPECVVYEWNYEYPEGSLLRLQKLQTAITKNMAADDERRDRSLAMCNRLMQFAQQRMQEEEELEEQQELQLELECGPALTDALSDAPEQPTSPNTDGPRG